MSKELEALHTIAFNTQINGLNFGDELRIIEQALQRLEAIDNAKPSEALKELEQDIKDRVILAEDKQLKLCAVIKQDLLKEQEQEKENELLKEIIKSFFDKGCPLHQYIDKEGILTIEVDSECSIMRLGVYKGVDLNKKLKEVLG